MDEKTELDLFVRLSRILTGVEDVDERFAESYLKRLKERYKIPMLTLLTTFKKIADDKYVLFEVKRRIIDDKTFEAIVPQIIRIWYTSEFTDECGKPHAGSQKEFYGGLLWRVIGAHAPTNSHLEYGDWQTPPEH